MGTGTRAIDTTSAVETPEGIELALTPAGPVPRGVAWLIDLLIRWGMLFGLMMALVWLGGAGMALVLIAWFLINWWYPVLFEVWSGGATPGKKAMKLRVFNGDGTPVGWGPSIVRNLLRQIDFLPFGYAAGLVSMFCNRRFQRLGDLAAGTVVVYRGDDRFTPAEVSDGPAEAPPVPLSVSEQQALLSLAERIKRLNPERARELSDLLAPLTGRTGQDGLEQVLAWARWIGGQRA